MNYLYHHKTILRLPLKPFKANFSEPELRKLFSQKDIQEALFLASPNLLIECEKWLKNDYSDKREEEKLIFSLLKYALRMHSRCTPYGLFAGCGVLENENNIVINPKEFKRKTRLDMNFTCALAQELAKKSFIQPYLKFYPNSSIYKLHDKIRYIEYFYKNKKRIHQISSVDYSDFLEIVIENAKVGATLKELSKLLVSEEITYDEAKNFIQEIVNAQLIVSELEPSVTGDELLNQMLLTISGIYETNPNNELREIIQLIQNIQGILLKIDNKIGNEISLYKNIAKQLRLFKIDIEDNRLFQADLFYSAQPFAHKTINQENTNTQKILTKALKVLNKLSFHNENLDIKTFKEKFYQRYEDCEIPLAEALDNETGIGYGSNDNQNGAINPLIENLFIRGTNSEAREITLHRTKTFLLKRLINAIQNNQYTVTINSDDVKEFEENWINYPNTFAVLYSHYGFSNSTPLLKIESAGGSSAVNLLGRFGSGNQKIKEIIKELAHHEQNINPNKIIASILHLPESRTGNILLRPVIRDYEIPYLSKSTLSCKQQISLDDLVISIKHNQIVLRSKSLNKEIIPRLDNSHNYSFNALPVYHFLCDLQTQDVHEWLAFDWGELKSEFLFLPRVKVENVVVSLATWQLKKENYKPLLEIEKNTKEEVIKWQKEWSLPNLILLVDGDNQLLIDLSSELSLKMFIKEIKKRDFIMLKEFLFDEKAAFIRGINGSGFTNEFIAILQKQYSHELSENLNLTSLNHENITRTFSLGSEWIYYKIYCGVKTADRILTEVIKPLVKQLTNQHLIDYWFFIRYSDPENHLRIRFHISNSSKLGEVILAFYNTLNKYQKTGLIWKIQADTYQREVERYGFNTMVLSEHFFYHDSECVVNFLTQIKNKQENDIRWLFGIKAIDELLNTFNYSLGQKTILLENLKIGFALEFSMNKDLKMQLDKKFRDKRKIIETFLWENELIYKKYQTIGRLLEINKNNITPIVCEILKMKNKELLELPLNDLIASYIHMFLNRLFTNKQRLQEMVVYDFMWRAYRSKQAKEKFADKP